MVVENSVTRTLSVEMSKKGKKSEELMVAKTRREDSSCGTEEERRIVKNLGFAFNYNYKS